MEKKMNNTEFEGYLNDILRPYDFEDYAPNGLQVEGRREIRSVAFGVTASLELIEKAASGGADALVVHHGWFWKSEPRTVVGMRWKRMKALMSADMNLYGYHLPLDAHPEIGNNARFAERLGLRIVDRIGPAGLVYICEFDEAVRASDLAEKLGAELDRIPLVLGDASKLVGRVGICTGAAQDFLGLAKSAGCDAFISGEASERTTYEAREQDIVYYSCGHHATERFGVKALMDKIAQDHPQLKLEYIEVDNPV